MADNTVLNAGTGGDTIASDDIAGVKHQRVKVGFGADGSYGDVSSANLLPVDASGATVPVSNAALTSLAAQVLDYDTGAGTATTVIHGIALPASGGPVAGGTSTNPIQVGDAGGNLSIDDGGNSITVDGAVTANAGTNLNTSALALESGGNLATLASAVCAEDAASADADKGVRVWAVRKATPANTSGTDGDYEALQISAGRLWASATIDAALPAGANAIGKLAANAGVTIGAVEIASAQTLATVTTVTTVSTVSTLSGGGVAHDGADSGNPVKVGAKCSLTLSDDTIVSNADRTDLTSDGDGALLVRGQFPLGDLISEALSNTDGASTASTNFGAVASTRSYISAIHAFRTDAGTTPIYIDFRDGTAGAVLFRVVLPPNGGVVLPAGAVPYFRTSTNTALAFDVSAATTTVYISLTGFKSKV